MKMRFLQRSVALLLFICMMFSVMPVEFMQVAFAETYGNGVPNFGGSGNNNKYGGVYSANVIGFRVALSREETNYLNGTKERRDALLEHYSSRWPTGHDISQNTIYLFCNNAVNWMSNNNNVPAANRGLVATYTPGHSDPNFYSGKYKKSIISYAEGQSAPTRNKFKEFAMSQYGNQVSSLAAYGDNVWMAHMPTYDEAIQVLGYIFQKSGSQYKVDTAIQYYVDLGNTPDPNTGRTAKFQDDPSTLTAKQKFEISAGYAGLLMCFYSVIAADADREGVASYFEEAINDYLGNKNTEKKPVTLLIDTAIAMVHTNMPDDNNGVANDENKTYVISTIDMIQYVGLTKETEAITNVANRILNQNANAKYSTKELIKAMHEISVIELPASETFAGKGPGTQIRFLDSTRIGKYQGGLGRHPVNWGASAYYFNTAMGGRIRNKQLNGNGVQWGDYAGEWPGYLGYLKLDSEKEIYGFMFVGQHIENPVPEVSYYVDPKVMMGNDVCTDTVKTTDASNITVYIKGDSSLISSLNSRKDDPNFAGIKINATVYRTDYLNGMAAENLHNPKQEMGELEAQLTTTLTGDEMISKLQGAPFLLKDMTLYEKDYDKIEGSSQSYFYVYDIYLDITIDGETYYFGSKGAENQKDTDTQEIKNNRTEIVQKSSNGSKVNFAEVSVSALSKDIPLPEDTVITKPTSPDITEIVNPSEQEKLEEQNQMIKRFGYSTEGTQFAEIKSNYPLQEKYEVMGGIPSSEEIYFSVGGMEYKVALVTQYWMNEHSRDRTYTIHFDGNICEYNNEGVGTGDRLPETFPIAQPAYGNGAYTDKSVHCFNENHTGEFDEVIVAEWSGNDKATCVPQYFSCNCGTQLHSHHSLTTPTYDAALADANRLVSELNAEDVVWTSASDKLERKQKWTASITTNTYDWSDTTTKGDKGKWCGSHGHSSGTHGSGENSYSCGSGSHSTGSACANNHDWHIVVTATIPKHSVCGPCCGHHMPDLWDTWRQGLVFDFVKISQMRLYKLDQGSVDGLQELTGTDTVFANVVSGQPTYFMNIAQFTEKNKYGQKILPSVFDTTTPAEDNISHITLNKENLMDTFITYLGSGTRDTSQSSRAGRLRYVLAHDHQESDTITFAEQGNGAASTTWTIDYKKIAAPEQHDDVIYEAGPRSKNCDGMATTGNFGKTNSNTNSTDYQMNDTGHVNEWADGCLYTNSLEKTVQEGILVEPTPDGTGVYMSASTAAYSGYWDPDVYGKGTWEENTLKTYKENDEHILKYKEDYNHHVVREDKLASVAENKDGTLLKKAYNDAADSRDIQSPEWQFFDKARRTKIIANVISDFLILQTSGGDQSIFYYEKESEPTEAQEHFQKVKMTSQELYLENPLSVFTGDTTCDMTYGAMVKSNVSEKFIIVGGYNGQYNEVDDKYRPYNLQDSKFKKFYDEGWAVYNTNTHEGNATEEGSENGYNRLGNTEIITIFDKGYSTAHGKTEGDPAGTIVRPERQATNQETSFRILQDNLQILPTAENKLYTPYNAKTYYSQVLGYYTIDRGVIDAYDRSTIVGPWGNVKIGWGQQVEHGEYYKEFWGQANGVDYPTKYYQVPIKDNISGDVISNETDSGSTTVNQLVVYTPVSTEDAIVMELEDLKFTSSDGSTVTASRDQRVNNFQYPNMNDLVNALKVCPLDPELCEYRYLDCKYHDDSVLAEFDFEPQYVEKEIRRVKEDKADGTYEVVQKIIDKDTKVNTYKNDAGNWVVTNKVTGVEYILPTDFTVESNSKVGTNRYLSAKGRRWAIPFSSLGLSTSKSNRVAVEMDLTVDSTSEDLMLVSFYNYGFIINPNKVLGSFVGRSSLDNSKFGPRMDAVSNTNLNKVRIELVFGFNNVVDCEAYILVGDARIPADVTVSDLKKIWKDEEINGVKTGVRKLVTEQVTIDDWINDAPETFATEDIGTNLIIGSWGSADNYTANYYIDNLKITLKGGTEGHNSTCYERLTVHATNRIHVHDSDCYLDEDMYTCTGELNANYKCNGAFNEHVHTDACYTNITNNSVNVPENESLTKEYIAKKDGTITIAGYGSCSSETWQATLTVNGTQIWNYNDDVAGNKTYNFKKDDIIEFYVYSYNSCDVGWNVSWTSGAFGEWTGNCTGALNTHVHTGVAGKDFPNGCYTEPSVHKHNHTPNVLVCGQTEIGGSVDLTPIDFDSTGAVQTTTLTAGRYKLQVWGARGGEGQNDSDYGYGGYSEGIITLNSTTDVFVYVGGEGSYSGEGGFNGGGSATSSGNNCGSGGGGTDIRIGEDSLYARVIVAGGGGGSGDDDSGSRGHGGGESGVKSTGTAGTQTSGYEFGVGQDGASGDYAGGGGGWYGAYDGTSEDPASGGSGYVYTESTAGNYPSGCKLNSSYYLSEAKTVAGSSEFVSPSGSTETGHDDAGFARITPLGGHTHTADCYAEYITESFNNVVCGIPTSGGGIEYTFGTGGNTYNSNYGSTSIKLPAGRYKFEVWGAQGVSYSSTYYGGKGGYSSGEKTFTKDTTVYVYVGGQGVTFNGGHATYGNYHYGSGGASHIATTSGELSSLSKSSILLVAGGGGGATVNGVGGYGGGANQNGGDGSGGYSNRMPGLGGTLSAGGAAGTGNNGSAGSFGLGGKNTSGSNSGGSMGGGGLYGGGAGSNDYSSHNDNDDGSGGGGSGYADSSLSSVSYTNGSREGNGFVKITSLSHTHTTNCYDKFEIPDGYMAYAKCGKEATGGTEFNETYAYESANYKTVTLDAGTYEVELYGAEGGYCNKDTSVKGSKGTYVRGTLELNSRTTVYLYIGGQGVPGNSKSGGFNGGGSSGGCSCGSGSGGGGTDIRIGGTDPSNRVMVAGGGGGAGTPSYAGYTTSKSNGTLVNGSAGASSDGGGGGGGYHGGAAGSSVDIGGYIGTSYVNNTEYTTDVSTDDYEVKHNNNSGNGKIVIKSTGHTHISDCYELVKINRCDYLPKDSLVCTGELNTTTDYNTHLHSVDCLTMQADIDPKMLRYTGGMQTYVVPWTDEYTIETYGTELNGRTGYAKTTVNLKAGQVLYVYVGGVQGYNNYATDVRFIMKPAKASAGEEPIEDLLTIKSEESRFISAGQTDNADITFIRSVEQCEVANGTTGMRGGDGNGRVLITCANTKVAKTIYQQIIDGEMSHADAKKYLGEYVYNKVMEGKENLLHTWEDWTYNNTKGFTEVQNAKLLYGGASLICGKTEADVGSPIDFTYKGYTESVTLSAGEYQLEVWGAQGGDSDSNGTDTPNTTGLGGYSTGIIDLDATTTLYISVGQAGSGPSNTSAMPGTFNGGGGTVSDTNDYDDGAGSGGGATDISLYGTANSTSWDTEDHLYSRIIVAGGGGGGGFATSGGYGGGTSGGLTTQNYSQSGGQNLGTPGTQNSGYSFGGSGETGYMVGGGVIGGGGGGWYSGGSGNDGSCRGGGAGGSGYVYTASTASNYPTGCKLNSDYYLTSAETIAGNQTFTSPEGTEETGHSGNGYARITPLSHKHSDDCYGGGAVGGTATTLTCGIPAGGDSKVRTYGTGGSELNADYGSKTTTLPAGRYRLETWGAQGGNSGGLGGYSTGILTLTSSTNLYIKVGQMGVKTDVAGGTSRVGEAAFNGGGKGSDSTGNYYAPSGGGGTDIRIGQDSLYARVIVAGGGGATGSFSTEHQGGYGGGVSGGSSADNTAGATQTSPGIGSYGYNQGSNATHSGAFGYGANSSSDNGNAGGGGGGWYGGASGHNSGSGGGGGSGFVYTSETSTYTNSSYTGGTWLLNSNYYLEEASTTAGNSSMPSINGGTEVGHSGNGFVKITTLDHQHTDACYTTVQIPDGYVLNCDITKDHVHSMENGCFVEFVGEEGLTVISSGNPAQFEVPLGNIPAEAISKIVVYAKNCPNNVGKIYLKDATNSYNEDDSVKSDTIVPNTENQVMTFILRDNPNLSGELTSLMFELANVKGQFNISKIEVYGYGYKVEGTGENNGSGVATEVYDFTYKGYTQTKQLTAGTYKLETWGATGASGRNGSNWRVEGGYSSGIVNLKSTTTLYINVGGAATNGGVSGGWNGGGNDNDTSAGGGGGATDISLRGTANSTSWNTTDHLNSRIIVAGGSGGGHEPSYGRGGYGGGTTGGNAFNEGSNSGSYNTFRGLGGSQNAGGDGATANATCTDGGFGYGGQGQDGGGGGSGWYGGGGGYGGIGGGGGSGYVLTSTSNKPTGYTPTSDYYMTSPVILSGNDSNRPANPAGTLTNGYARITALNTFTPLEITYRDPFDGSENIILQKDENGDYLYLNKIPDKINGEYNPIWVCKFKEFNAHICESENSLGEMVKICLTHVVFNCVEPHHRGEHYAGSNKICWSACGEDENHVNTKTEVQIGEETVRLANFLQLDAGFTVYFPNRGDFRGNDAHGLSQPQITRGMGYKNNMDTTQWTREKRVKFPFEVIFDDKENGEMAMHQPNTWIELDVETEYFNFYVPVANQELSNARVEFEVEAINCGTNAGVKVKRSIRKGGYIEYSDSVSTAYLKELNDFRTEYITVLLRSIQAGYSIPYPSATGGNTAEFTDFEKFAYWRLFTDKAQTIEKPLIDAVETIDRQIERDFEGTKSNTDNNAPKDSVDLIWPHNKSGNGINDDLKKITNNDNKNYIDNKLRSNSLESLHGGYKSFYLDVIGRIGNFAITDTDDFRFSNFFKVSIDRLPYAKAFDETDPDNWLVEGLVLKVDEGVQNYYIGDTYDLRGNKASKETRWLDTYNTEKWMTGEMVIGTNKEGALVIDRDITKPNLKSQILTGNVNNIDVLRDEELRFGYDTYTSVITAGSYAGGYVQVIPKYYALKLTDKAGSDSYDEPKGTYVPLDVYINKDGLYTAVNIFGNAENGEPNKKGLKLHDFAFNLDWTTEAERRNYTIEEKERTLKIKEILTILDYGVSEEDGRDWETIMNDNKNQEPSLIELVIPRGRNNYIGTPQYMLMDGKHRTFIGSSESHGGNKYERKGLTTEWPIDKNIDEVIYPVRFEQNVQRWHGKLGVPSSSVFVPSGKQVNSDTIKYVMNDEWAIICTAEIIAIGDTWSIAYSQPWFKTLTINGTEYDTCKNGNHYPGHRVYDGNDSVQCEDCIPPIIAVYSSDSSSVDDIEIVQTH